MRPNMSLDGTPSHKVPVQFITIRDEHAFVYLYQPGHYPAQCRIMFHCRMKHLSHYDAFSIRKYIHFNAAHRRHAHGDDATHPTALNGILARCDIPSIVHRPSSIVCHQRSMLSCQPHPNIPTEVRRD
jgi:hypothetical protein